MYKAWETDNYMMGGKRTWSKNITMLDSVQHSTYLSREANTYISRLVALSCAKQAISEHCAKQNNIVMFIEIIISQTSQHTTINQIYSCFRLHNIHQTNCTCGILILVQTNQIKSSVETKFTFSNS